MRAVGNVSAVCVPDLESVSVQVQRGLSQLPPYLLTQTTAKASDIQARSCAHVRLI